MTLIPYVLCRDSTRDDSWILWGFKPGWLLYPPDMTLLVKEGNLSSQWHHGLLQRLLWELTPLRGTHIPSAGCFLAHVLQVNLMPRMDYGSLDDTAYWCWKRDTTWEIWFNLAKTWNYKRYANRHRWSKWREMLTTTLQLKCRLGVRADDESSAACDNKPCRYRV